MAIEIERKFLVKNDSWRTLAAGTVYRQGYIVSDIDRTVRIRLAGDRGYITIKGATSGISRSEFEYEIPGSDASELLDTLCDRPLIEKTRYKIPYGDLLWEVDEFVGENQGLVVAEVELTHPDQQVTLPDWIGQEVSDDPRYLNSNLVKLPFSQWK
ncbi:MAG: CYTH domain-containing protein [Drouetiella hepatica Uher 2000/2452]|jgi:CYTH domain-containing protein|uniref:CYTH domain-containing protein n=1 Tax=Drouetiella hepatica Uher 2000/2452 TaxID=904376 RepID=A0A951QCC3_9CYAN|nr:CYTH domain-containing protein [Drouetiella hepatica Uher 2000/2452]